VPSYRVTLDVPRELILFVSALLAARRRSIGTRKRPVSWAAAVRRCSGWPGSATRRTSAARRGVRPVPGHRLPLPRRGHRRAGGAGPGTAGGIGACRGRGNAVRDPRRQDHRRRPLPTRKPSAARARSSTCWYSGKKRDFGGNVQALFHPNGRPMWVSEVLPGNVNDLSAARKMVLSVIGEFRRKYRNWTSTREPGTN
jgi:DDE superfamily endonuclease